MDLIIGVASLVASIIAAIYGALAWHRPKSPKRQPPPRFVGELPECGVQLSEFLNENRNSVVDLHIFFRFYYEDDQHPEFDFIHIQPSGGEKDRYFLVLSDIPREKGNLSLIWNYQILSYGSETAFASDPGGSGYANLSGSFIPISMGAGKRYLYGRLIQLEPLERLRLDA